MKNTSTLSILFFLFILLACKKDKDPNTPPPDLKSDLIAYFPLNGNFNDSTKKAQNVAYGGFTSEFKNRYGYLNRAIAFNGGSFSFGGEELPAKYITISLWVKVNNLNTEGYLVNSTERAFGVYQAKSKFGFSIGIPDMATALADISTEWTHFAGTYDGKDIKTYLNGKLATTLHHPGTPDVTTLIGIGAPDIPEWKGVLDDIRFYSRVLTEAEILLLSQL